MESMAAMTAGPACVILFFLSLQNNAAWLLLVYTIKSAFNTKIEQTGGSSGHAACL